MRNYWLIYVVLLAGMVPVYGQQMELNRPYAFPEYSAQYTRRSMVPVMTPGKRLYVSPQGRDSANGSKASPYKTLIITG